ncbi:MAG: histidinol-phosphate transaminase [Candidatus Desulforudis sp.]|nr:histidinol-phosphate transaminase [Desulforudis sp.]
MSELARKNVLDLAVYRPGKPIDEVQRELGLTEVVKLASNENAVGPSPSAIAALHDVLNEVHYYPDGSGYRLRQALAGFFGVEPGYIHLGNGSNEIVQQLSLAFLEPGDEAVMPVPSFPRYQPLARMMDAVPREVPLKNDTLDLEAMAAQINPRTKLIYICNPNNPTGTLVTKDAVDRFLAAVPGHCLVVLDEAYFEYVEDNNYPDGLEYVKAYPNVVVLRTFSKIYGLAGLRIGYAFARPEIVDCLERVREPFNVNSMAQEAALAALADQDHVAGLRALNDVEKQYLYRELAQMGLDYVPTEANFILFDAGRDEQRVFQSLLRRGVIIRGGFGYGTRLRVTIGTRDQNRKFLRALEATLREDE